MKADVYAAYEQVLKLGGKQLYKDFNMDFTARGLEAYQVFFSDSLDFKEFSFFHIRSYRILSIILKTIDKPFYEYLYSREIDPTLIFMYFFH